MAMSVVYTTFCGEIVHEVRNGVERYYVPDTNGNTVQLLDAAGTKTDEWTYWPFGEVRTRTGTTATPFTFGGALGYYTDTVTGRMYVRARYLRADLARWQIVDPLWPDQPPYSVSDNSPMSITDTSGTHTSEVNTMNPRGPGAKPKKKCGKCGDYNLVFNSGHPPKGGAPWYFTQSDQPCTARGQNGQWQKLVFLIYRADCDHGACFVCKFGNGNVGCSGSAPNMRDCPTSTCGPCPPWSA